jgi:SAM-dependent methyltransferase
MDGQDTQDLPDHVRINREVWDTVLGPWYAARARERWAAEPRWGVWAVPQTDLPFLPADLAGKDLIELGCGTAYVSAWSARAGARPIGIDNSAQQLAIARAMQAEFDLTFPLVHGNAEQTPFPDASFDLAVSEHGASTWCDPYRWIPEAARLLRPGGELVFSRNSDLLTLCLGDDDPARTTLRRDQRGLSRIDDDGQINFVLPHGPLIRLLRRAGFVVEDMIEVYAPEEAPMDVDNVDREWGRRWPAEEVWKARLVDASKSAR